MEENNQESGNNSTTTISVQIETTDFPTVTTNYLNVTSTTNSMSINTTQLSTMISDNWDPTKASETVDNNHTYALNISLDVELELTLDYEVLEKIFGFLADKVIGKRFDKMLEITQFITQSLGPSISILVKKNVLRMANKKKFKKFDIEEFDFEELLPETPECPVSSQPTQDSECDNDENAKSVCISLWGCKSKLLRCHYDLWFKQKMPNDWEPEMNQKDGICKLRSKIQFCETSVNSDLSMPIK